MPRIEFGAIVALGIAVAGGLVWLGQMSEMISNLEMKVVTLEENQTSEAVVKLKEQVKNMQMDIEDVVLDRFSKFPVGTIIPFVGKKEDLGSLVRWKICDGSVLQGARYKDSPFYNQTLPELDGVFLRATLSNDKLLKPGGSKTHTHPQPHTHTLPHTHSGQTDKGINRNGPRQDHHHEGGIHIHDFKTTSQSELETKSLSADTTEDGESMPPYIGVFYIIKVI